MISASPHTESEVSCNVQLLSASFVPCHGMPTKTKATLRQLRKSRLDRGNDAASAYSLPALAYSRCICAQIRYMLGDGGRSLVVGTGSDPPQFPNVQSASCPSPPATCLGQAAEFSGEPNPQVAMGSLIYGDSANNDLVSDERLYSANMVGVSSLLLQSVPPYAVLISGEHTIAMHDLAGAKARCQQPERGGFMSSMTHSRSLPACRLSILLASKQH